ncbi:tRNA (adenosine(37)-N6)-dimethylallyltransferase MiaA [Thalassobaculum sp.]|uniref:tRNA (adenosine(37)-N6)-dimethylallyltransferase MiaA n=1 Tax=Thalassobaculum sp. TaxID=2022740 RepID=UPI0032EF036C
MSSRPDPKTVLVIAGPTASGKSALAMHMAEAMDGVVINADSMQVYRDLRILTDRPGPVEEGRVPHRLFGVLDGADRGSAAWWRDAALAEIKAATEGGRLAIVCGGTGLYLRALLDGLADIPPVPDAVVQAAAARFAAIGGDAFRSELHALDPLAADRLFPGDARRLQRAWAVATGTGRALSSWQADAARPPGEITFRTVLLFPPRPVSADAVEQRFRTMVETGAIEEVENLLARALDPALPVMKALGVPQIAAFLDGRASLDEAVRTSVTATRQYAKRQRTWFRHQFRSDYRIDAKFSESAFEKIFPKIRELVLTLEC